MEKMEGKTESLEMVNENNGRLLTELDSLVNKLQISYEHQVHTPVLYINSFFCCQLIIYCRCGTLLSVILSPL